MNRVDANLLGHGYRWCAYRWCAKTPGRMHPPSYIDCDCMRKPKPKKVPPHARPYSTGALKP